MRDTIMNAKELEQYKREIISEHEAEISAIDRLIARERNKPGASQNGFHEPRVVSIVPTTRRVRGRQSGAHMVRLAVRRLTGRFTRDEISQNIRTLHPSSPQTNRTISIELWKLAKAGEIRTLKEGRGRIPAVYEKA